MITCKEVMILWLIMVSSKYELSYVYKDSSCWSQLPNNIRTQNDPQIILKNQMFFQNKNG